MSNTPIRGSAGEIAVVAATAAYLDLIDRLKQRIRESQARAARTLNTELVMLYWSIGRDILDQQQAGGWGDDVVGRIAQDLAADTGPARGFSRRNLFYMRRFAALWPDLERVPSVMAQIGWTANRVLLDLLFCAPRGANQPGWVRGPPIIKRGIPVSNSTKLYAIIQRQPDNAG
jgi:DUF1016 N-terminal domain